MKKYTFESQNKGNIEFSIVGEYSYAKAYDIEVTIEESGEIELFEEMDGGSVEDMFAWLIDQGVEFESDFSLWFNVHYVASVMIDGDSTKEKLLDQVEKMTIAEVTEWRQRYIG